MNNTKQISLIKYMSDEVYILIKLNLEKIHVFFSFFVYFIFVYVFNNIIL
jgi:hypothetical protein